jgi:hypothetical protein
MSGWNGHVRRICRIPAPLLHAATARLSALTTSEPAYWELHDAVKPNRHDIFKRNTQHIALGFPVNPLHTRGRGRRYPAWKEWNDVIQPIIDVVTRAFGYERVRVKRILLAKLLAGCDIPMHVDTDPSSRLPHKIHVPLVTNRRVAFFEERSRYRLPKGYAYEVNNQVPHGGANRGATDRVHLIFDVLDATRTP